MCESLMELLALTTNSVDQTTALLNIKVGNDSWKQKTEIMLMQINKITYFLAIIDK